MWAAAFWLRGRGVVGGCLDQSLGLKSKSQHTLKLALLVYQAGLLHDLLFPSVSLGFVVSLMVLRSIWLKIFVLFITIIGL